MKPFQRLKERKAAARRLIEPTLQQLQALGYQTGDRVYFRAIPAKNIPVEAGKRLGMRAYTPKKSKGERLGAVSGYIELLPQGLRTYKVFGNTGKTAAVDLHSLNRMPYGVYLVVNPGGGEDGDITEARTIFYECDDISKAEQWARLKALEARLGSARSVIETRKSLHCYFGLAQPTTDLEVWEKLQQRLIQAQDSDPSIFNPARLMRLAGFNHWKWNSDAERAISTPVTVQQLNPNAVVSLSALDSALPEWDSQRWGTKTRGGEFEALDAGENPWDIRNFAQYLEWYSTGGRRGWITAKCPAHNGESDNSLHINESTGAFKCHAGCHSRDVYSAAKEVAKSSGYQLPSGGGSGRFGALGAAKRQPGLFGLTAEGIEVINQRYLGEIPAPVPGSITAISSAMETGKTYALNALRAKFIEQHPDGIFDVPGYRNGLGRQTAERTGMAHLRDMECDTPGVAQMLIDDSRSLAYCLDSLHRRSPEIFRTLEVSQQPVWWVIDEADAVIRHLLLSSTLKGRRAETIKTFAEIVQGIIASGGAIFLMEAELSQLAVDFVAELAGKGTPARYIKNEYQPHNWDVTAPVIVKGNGSPSPGMQRLAAIEKAVELVSDGQRTFFYTDSQRLAEQLAAMLEADGHRVGVLHGENSEEQWARDFLANPGGYLAENGGFDAFITTTTAESGLSIPEGHFEARVVYGAGVVEPRALVQGCGRVRGNTPLHVFAKYRGFDADTAAYTPDAVLKEWQANANDSWQACDGANHFEEKTDAVVESRRGTQNGVGAIAHRAAAAYQARRNITAANLRRSLIQAFEQAGHSFQQPECLNDCIDPEGDIAGKLKAAREELQDKETVAYLAADGTKSVSWASKVMNSPGSSRDDRRAANKVLTLSNYPGLPLSTDEDFVKTHIVKAKGRTIKAFTMKWLIDHPEIAVRIDQESWSSQIEKNFMWLPAIKRESVKALTLADSGILELTQLDSYSNECYTAKRIADWVKARKASISRLFRLTIRDEHSTVDVVNKLLRKLGYNPKRGEKPGRRGQQVQHWHTGAESKDRGLVEAALNKKWEEHLKPEKPAGKEYCEPVSSIRKEDLLLQIDDTPRVLHDDRGGGVEKKVSTGTTSETNFTQELALMGWT